MHTFLFNKSKTLIYLVPILSIVLVSSYFCAWFVLHHDLNFNTDIARDFLLLEDIINTHKLPLIGPRSGGIPGVFHGPLWLYLNLPSFIVGKGNPLSVGWFWIFLIACSEAVIYYISRKLFGKITGILAAALFAITQIPNANSLFNPYGAVLLFPLFFYFFYLYTKTHKVALLLWSLFLCGLTIQFQIAFGGPILFLASFVFIFHIWKIKKMSHLLAFFVLLIPFSTYILFDVRHGFLQIHAIISYVFSSHTHQSFHFSALANRWDGMVNTISMVSYPSRLLTLSLFALFGYYFCRAVIDKKFPARDLYLYYLYFFIGYFILSFGFSGVVWGYYYWPFIGVTIMVFCSGFRSINKILFLALYMLVCYAGVTYVRSSIDNYPAYSGKDTGSWLFNETVAQNVFKQHDSSFGYYVFSPDEFGYSPRYAMDYVAKQFPHTTVLPYQKEHITYLLISPPGGKDKSIGGDWWKVHRVRISVSPVKTWSYPNGFRVEKFVLSPSDIAIPSDPNLINSVFFR